MTPLDCPSVLTIVPGPLDPPSTVFSPEQYFAVAGELERFVLSWFDEFGNAVDEDPPFVVVGVPFLF